LDVAMELLNDGHSDLATRFSLNSATN